jgi:hypothetical protein
MTFPDPTCANPEPLLLLFHPNPKNTFTWQTSSLPLTRILSLQTWVIWKWLLDGPLGYPISIVFNSSKITPQLTDFLLKPGSVLVAGEHRYKSLCPKCPKMDEEAKHGTALRWTILTHVTAWMNFEDGMLREISQTQKDKCYMSLLTHCS